MPKIEYLVRVGFTKHEAGMALYSLSQFTIGCVLEEQATNQNNRVKAQKRTPSISIGGTARPSATEAFEFGLKLFVEGLEKKRRSK